MEEVNLKEEPSDLYLFPTTNSSVELLIVKKEESELCITPEPKEFSLHNISVKTEDDEEKCSVLHQRPNEEKIEETDVQNEPCSNGSQLQSHSESQSQTHMLLHTGKSTHKSAEWGKTSSCGSLSQKHFRGAHRGELTLGKTDLKKHSTVHRRKKPHKCSFCERYFKKRWHLKTHLRDVHHTCPVCETSFQPKMELYKHLRTHVEEGTLGQSIVKTYNQRPFSCKECDKSLTSNSALLSHVSGHSEKGPHKCLVCGKRFVREFSLTLHQALTHHICPVCSESFSDQTNIIEHLRTHVDEGTLDQSSFIFRIIVKSFSCADCGVRFRLKSHLQRHMLIHKVKPHKCSLCEKSFKEQTSLTEHLKQVHHFCPVCETCILHMNNINDHLKTHVEEGTLNQLYMKPFRCSECGSCFGSKSLLRKHVWVHIMRPHKCSVCERSFQVKTRLTKHLKQVHHFCTVCETCFPDENNLTEHLKTHVEKRTFIKPFNCAESGNRFTANSALQSPISGHSVKETHKCSICEKTFTKSNYLQKHMQRHARKKPFICTVCERGFIKKPELIQHQTLVHHICPVCSTGFSDRNSLGEHIKTHVDEGILDQSSFIFRKVIQSLSDSKSPSSILQSQLSVHTGVRPHICPVCETPFSDENKLKEHLRTHVKGGSQGPSSECGNTFNHKDRQRQTEKKCFKCSVCEREYKHLASLKTHMKTHTRVKPSICPVCGKGFNHKSNLQTHMKIHSGQKAFVCSFCDKGFESKTELEDHMTTHIKEQTMTLQISKVQGGPVLQC